MTDCVPATEHEKICKQLADAERRNVRIRQLSAARAAVLVDWYDKLLEMGWDLKDDLAGLGVSVNGDETAVNGQPNG